MKSPIDRFRTVESEALQANVADALGPDELSATALVDETGSPRHADDQRSGRQSEIGDGIGPSRQKQRSAALDRAIDRVLELRRLIVRCVWNEAKIGRIDRSAQIGDIHLCRCGCPGKAQGCPGKKHPAARICNVAFHLHCYLLKASRDGMRIVVSTDDQQGACRNARIFRKSGAFGVRHCRV